MCNFFWKADNKVFNFWRSILWTFWLKFAALITHRMKCSGSLELSGRMHFMWKILWWNSITFQDELSIQRCHICHILAFVTRDTGNIQKIYILNRGLVKKVDWNFLLLHRHFLWYLIKVFFSSKIDILRIPKLFLILFTLKN